MLFNSFNYLIFFPVGGDTAATADEFGSLEEVGGLVATCDQRYRDGGLDIE